MNNEENTQAAPHVEYLISTDLDGTLLDHHTYSWAEASPAINLLKEHAIPIVINTSKTREEVIALQQEIELCDPFIVENGSAIFIHANDDRFERRGMVQQGNLLCETLGIARAVITDKLKSLKAETGFKFTSFSEFSVQDIIDHTGLSEAGAQLAQNRAYSEPLIWQDSDENFDTFKQAILSAGFKILHGGRFIHILGKTNKGLAAQSLMQRMKYEGQTQMIALGDSGNDLDMLNIASTPVLIKSPAHEFPNCIRADAIKTTAYGPKGWNDTIIDLIF
ncbi:HAD-IIB family hydrolase [Saccharophagus degradans]|uniref:HAD-IIB family hydrolase n=1 Tax=Saccharophagus degradans TaxID=86304 RepID=UPI0024781F29|nr:HAD-IIB family hydrolase [Saccharophagus degradans]WGO99339.1 HAD-IIB family hydrolase [Saccharophagus degradans]